MSAAYNGPPAGRQSPPAAPGTGAAKTARASADRMLLASFAAADQATALRIDKLLRERAAELLQAASSDVAGAAHRCLAALATDCDCDCAALTVLNLPSRRLQVEAQLGQSMLLAATLEQPLFDAIVSALHRGRALEHPATGVQEAVSASLAALLAERGVQSLRWTFRRLDDDSVAIVALQATWRCRYWTPATRHLHEGTADLLVALPRRSRHGGPAEH